MKKVAINGLGRIGRLILRNFIETPPGATGEIEIVAANDLTPMDDLAYLMRYDSVHGRAPFEVKFGEGFLDLGGKRITVTHEKDPANLPWKALGIDTVMECTGAFRGRADAGKHIDAGASHVIISAPSEDVDATFIVGVNEKTYDPAKHRVVSNASCTTNSLAPTVKVMNDTFGVEYLFVTTVHAYTSSQSLVDKAARKMRRGRAAAVSFIPTSTGAADATALVIPELKGRMNAIAVRAPVPDGSLTDIVAVLKKDVTVETLNGAFKAAADGPLKGILAYSEEELVSADIIGCPHSGVVDGLSTMVIKDRFVKVFVWYDNEYGYSHRMLDLARHMARE
jgi:glyceraldehyde 3-phosphate dehydrogenase/glyceraldehyde-3-phosphate dehydrogenase (NAD(P))